MRWHDYFSFSDVLSFDVMNVLLIHNTYMYCTYMLTKSLRTHSVSVLWSDKLDYWNTQRFFKNFREFPLLDKLLSAVGERVGDCRSVFALRTTTRPVGMIKYNSYSNYLFLVLLLTVINWRFLVSLIVKNK